MAESYSSTDNRSTPALPSLPERQIVRFQFSLKQLLAYMLASAVLAAGLRYVLAWVERLPQHHLTGLQNTIVFGLAFGGLLYFVLRVPFLAIGGARAWGRWRRVQQHRRELADWARQVRCERERRSPDESQASGAKDSDIAR